MSQSKSILMPFIIIAVLIFGGALAWKSFQGEAPAVEEKPAKPVVEKPAKKVIADTEEFEIIEYDDSIEAEPAVMDEALLEEKRKLAPHFMDFAIKYDSEAKLLKALKKNHEMGRTEKFELLLKYAERTFPDLEIPSFE